LRSQRKNFRARVTHDATVLHKVSRSIGNKTPAQVFLRARNACFVWEDNVHGFRRVLLPGQYLGMVIRYARLLLDENNGKAFDACLNGFWAAVRGRGGAYDPAIAIPPWLKAVFSFFVTRHPYFWINLFTFNVRGMALAACQRIGFSSRA
jgi:hypothetical protein